MDDLSKLPHEIPEAIAKELSIGINPTEDAIRVALSLPETPAETLLEIGKSLPWSNLDEFAPMLVSHPNFTDETLAAIVGHLKILWWDDDPTECRLAWQALERERAAYLVDNEEVSTSIFLTD